ncbi:MULTISPECIES: hypothetical protein [unclassified Streptococcus]|uniref:DUF7365 family protein n=1 Tax=unclassified Streptococcus TaxID=2608887 RepID=UPI001072DA28|nr:MULTISPECIES: hypothetical protein [unclassified Streptococcus]MBF0788305.1 hypothetical protein [Streptococcus sp. 19428wC2_LYSM12]MCQ9212293.1 hypothetical protein [Streptococcus sp. B01]MCQ9213624.1 hypothetical protein [Streptococcus sp. O1]TFV04601.1 hypothetical protein E4T79_10455 [Streptococcus sp. LYSM12]
MLESIKAEFLLWLVSTAIPVLGMYVTNKGKIKEAEHRMTVLEMKVENAEKKSTHNATRLDGHDEQYRAMYAIVEQVKHLSMTLEEVRHDVKSLTRKEN